MSVLWVHRFVHHRTLLFLNAVASKWVENDCGEYYKRYLMLVREKVMPCLRKRDAISTVTFMQNGKPVPNAISVKAF